MAARARRAWSARERLGSVLPVAICACIVLAVYFALSDYQIATTPT